MSESCLANEVPLTRDCSTLAEPKLPYRMNKKEYQKYLRSEDWEFKKQFKQSRSVKRCGICASDQNIQLHHLFYRATPQESENSDLRWLCARCHMLVHTLMTERVIRFLKPRNHNSCFVIVKSAVKKYLGIDGVNLFAARSPRNEY